MEKDHPSFKKVKIGRLNTEFIQAIGPALAESVLIQSIFKETLYLICSHPALAQELTANKTWFLNKIKTRECFKKIKDFKVTSGKIQADFQAEIKNQEEKIRKQRERVPYPLNPEEESNLRKHLAELFSSDMDLSLKKQIKKSMKNLHGESVLPKDIKK